MKHVLLAIFVFLASMPLHASCDDMHQSQDAPQSQQGDMMDHGDMDHGDMNMDMDCCDHDSIDPMGNCDPLSHCGAPASSVVTIDTSTINVVYIAGQHHVLTDAARATSQFTSPPFRPPIA